MSAPLLLDGRWTLHPGDTPDGTPAGVDDLPGRPIEVPGLWEAQGMLHLDGVAWYRRSFHMPDLDAVGPGTHWTLRFDAVMDSAEVWVNDRHVGGHELQPYTPFEFDVTGSLRAGANTLAVRVDDPPRDDPRLTRSAHGKQGWFNEVFPSPPSLYATYGGIWQSVTLRPHGPVTVEDVFVDPDPDALAVTVEVRNRLGEPWHGELAVSAAGLGARVPVVVPAGATVPVRLDLGATGAPRWSPESPTLHEARARLSREGVEVDGRASTFGLRTIRVEGSRLLLNEVPLRVRAALVQGFWPSSLYAAPGREQIEQEVRAAREAGFNTLRLHVKAFEPAYLDVCDETGMLLHCDVPVAEPVDHDDLGADTELARRCRTAVEGQVRRDRNHPAVILWSAMNEIGLDRPSSRATDGYEAFARALAEAVRDADPTRPVIENDWIEPDPDRVFDGDVLTAHWYGRLQREYFATLEEKAAAQAGLGRPLLVTEFGDWGLPELDGSDGSEDAFWAQGDGLATDILATAWPGTPDEFATGTQRYQGLADRLQGEVLRRTDHIGGYCLTELTDVPYELNGVLDLHRRPKPAALAEVRRLNQPVLPMASLTGFTLAPGARVTVPLHVANDGPPLLDATVRVRLDDAVVTVLDVGDLPGHRTTPVGVATCEGPGRGGDARLRLEVEAGGRIVGENSYPLWVTGPGTRPPVELVGDGPTETALDGIRVRDADGPSVLVVAEGCLDPAARSRAEGALADGRVVVVLHQDADAAGHYPAPVRLAPIHPQWGPTVYHFTTASPVWSSLPPARLLTTEHAAIEGTAVLDLTGPTPAAEVDVVVGAYRPPPERLVGAAVAALPVGRGRLVVSQLRLAGPAAAGDLGAAAVLADVLSWAAASTGDR